MTQSSNDWATAANPHGEWRDKFQDVPIGSNMNFFEYGAQGIRECLSRGDHRYGDFCFTNLGILTK
jgi:hypothetical protein